MRWRATIAEAVTLVRGVQTWGTLRGHERREVPVPRFLVDDLAAHVAGRKPPRPLWAPVADRLDQVADRLDASARAVVYPLCTRADIIPTSADGEETENPLLGRGFSG
jgi:hypothetical protein